MWGWIIGGFFVAAFLPSAARVAFDYLIKPKLRGAAQESSINRMFRKFKGKGFARLNDVMVRTGDKTNQIDNLLITRHGVFVIESKNYSGVIQGRERTPRWLQTFPNGKKKPREFFNPIWQNEGHIRALKQVLGRQFPKLQYHNLVVFSDNCQCPRIPGVIKLSDMNKTIKQAMSGPPILSEEDVAKLKELLEKSNIKDHKSRSEHLDHVQNAAFKAKERERIETLRKRGEENKDMAMRVQMAYSGGHNDLARGNEPEQVPLNKRPSLDIQIQDATSCTTEVRFSDKTPQKDIAPER